MEIQKHRNGNGGGGALGGRGSRWGGGLRRGAGEGRESEKV